MKSTRILIMLYVIFTNNGHYINAQLYDGSRLSLGPFKTSINVGHLPIHSSSLSNPDLKASNNTRMLIEALRHKFKTGFFPLPPLDPYEMKNVSKILLDNAYSFLVTGEINVKKIKIIGARKFHLDKLQVFLNKRIIDFGFNIPVLKIIVALDADLILGNFIPLQVSGTVRITAKEIDVNGSVFAVGHKKAGNSIFELRALRSQVKFDKLDVNLEGLDLDKDAVETIKSFDTPETMAYARSINSAIEKYVGHQILKQVNNMLSNLTVNQVTKFLLSD